jgi:uncharacterized membrane protein YbhN (UPF0104 family)
VLFSANPPGTGLRSMLTELAPGTVSRPRRRRLPAIAIAVVGAALLAWLISTHGASFVHAIERAFHANWQLVVLAAVLEAASVGGYVLLLHRVVSRASAQLRLKDSYDITLGGATATRLLPTAGLGGAAVTVWALRARGVRSGELAERLLAFLLLLYGVYLAALFASGAAVAAGLVKVSAGRGVGILGASLAVAVAATIIVLFAVPERIAAALGARSGRLSGAARQLPVLRAALGRGWLELRRPHPALLGALAWWGFDIGVLVTMLHAFGVGLSLPVVVLAYFLGTMLNLLPLPGSLSSGLAGALIALGSPVGGTIAAVLAYRALAVWLPAAPGIASLASLRRSVAGWREGDVVVAAPADARSPYRSRTRSRRQYGHDIGQLQGATNVAT